MAHVFTSRLITNLILAGCLLPLFGTSWAAAGDAPVAGHEKSFWKAPGNWYKGNLHTHTTNSDGDLAPAEIVARYKEAGYDFLALSDHNKLTRLDAPSDDRFLLIDGEEITAGHSEIGGEIHLVAFNIKERINPREFTEPQKVLDAVRAQGGEVVIAHPCWSGLTLKELMGLEGYLGIEIYNASCFYSIGKGHSLSHWDDLLVRGRRIMGYAHDDSHGHFNDHRPTDVARASLMVKAPALTKEAIMGALRKGEFYACSENDAPKILDFWIADGHAHARTSVAKLITFAADPGRGFGEMFTAPKGTLLQEARHKLRGKEKYIRLDVTDADGRTSWSNPIFLPTADPSK